MLQFRNFDRIIEPETILKNEASLKSRMSRVNFFWKVCFALLLASFVLIGCNKDEEKGNKNGENMSMVDGVYIHKIHKTYKIVVQGNTWISMINNVNYGKGTYNLYDDNKVSGRSTHAWEDGMWIPYKEDTFSGTYDKGNNSVTIKSTGYDTNFNGTYSRQ